MRQPRETDLPGVLLVLVVLPLVAYVLLGIWGEASRKKKRISELAAIAAEEAAAAATVVPLVVPVPMAFDGFHECARCYGRATTRCSRCKSVRYCSGKCQIIHWRQVHKHECQVLEHVGGGCTSPDSASNEESASHERFSFGETSDSPFFESNIEHENPASDDTPAMVTERRSSDKRVSRKPNRETAARREESGTFSPSRETCSTSYDDPPLKENSVRHKAKRSHAAVSKEETQTKNGAEGNTTGESGFAESMESAQNWTNSSDVKMELAEAEIASSYETRETDCFSERSPTKRSSTTKPTLHSPGTKTYKSAKSTAKAQRDHSCSGSESVGQIAEDSGGVQGGTSSLNKGFMKMIGLKRSSKHHDKAERSEVNADKHKKVKMLFPYEEFVNFFHYEATGVLPRGLVNCGNSCYANAVLQCLTSTKPLTVYLLRQSHSRECCSTCWCLMCELERHVTMLRSDGEPLSLSRILSRMRSGSSQIGDGSQEDAHEFLRVLVTSMQSICLEGLGGENVVDPKLQETTFIQQTFGGLLRSKVKCLRCHHESNRYENIMDLTLEIFGWVESLEDALTQFTSPEDLDGENMYRCARCAAYVRARKQLAIQEAPNILTIVLKRFQEGSYGKINKGIAFPDVLDMVPFMTGTDDVPPLYVLYGVVVHLDTMNASFSGHYISYVKDLHGNWFRIDDTQVQPVPLSQVMSEGAYILFYTRSSPRPPRSHAGKHRHKVSAFSMPKAPKPSSHSRETTNFQGGPNRNRPVTRDGYGNPFPSSVDFSDTTSSDWSIFTSSDDASFTTESTRDSFSTVDYAADAAADPISSIFNAFCTPPDYLPPRCGGSRLSRSGPHTAGPPPYRLHKAEVCSSSSAEDFHPFSSKLKSSLRC